MPLDLSDRAKLLALFDALAQLPFHSHTVLSTVLAPDADTVLRDWVSINPDYYLDGYDAHNGWYVAARRKADHVAIVKVNTGMKR